jgi:hypothetical protein
MDLGLLLGFVPFNFVAHFCFRFCLVGGLRIWQCGVVKGPFSHFVPSYCCCFVTVTEYHFRKLLLTVCCLLWWCSRVVFCFGVAVDFVASRDVSFGMVRLLMYFLDCCAQYRCYFGEILFFEVHWGL